MKKEIKLLKQVHVLLKECSERHDMGAIFCLEPICNGEKIDPFCLLEDITCFLEDTGYIK